MLYLFILILGSVSSVPLSYEPVVVPATIHADALEATHAPLLRRGRSVLTIRLLEALYDTVGYIVHPGSARPPWEDDAGVIHGSVASHGGSGEPHVH